jgi:hypothetical protein
MNLANWAPNHTIALILGALVVTSTWLLQQGIFTSTVAAGVTTALIVIKTIIGILSPSASAPQVSK